MPIRRVVRGRGMLRAAIEYYEVPETAQQWDAEIGDHLKSISGTLAFCRFGGPWRREEEQAVLIMRKRKMPERGGRYRQRRGRWERWRDSDKYDVANIRAMSGGSWRELDRFDDCAEISEYRCIDEIAEQLYGDDSDEHRAALMLQFSNWVRLCRRPGMQRAREAYVFLLARHVAQIKLAARAEIDWARGRKISAGGRKGAEALHANKDQQRELVMSALRRKLDSGIPLREARRQVARTFQITERTIRRYEITPRVSPWT